MQKETWVSGSIFLSSFPFMLLGVEDLLLAMSRAKVRHLCWFRAGEMIRIRAVLDTW